MRRSGCSLHTLGSLDHPIHMHHPPDLVYPEDRRLLYEPSWTRADQFINAEHGKLVRDCEPCDRAGVSDFKLYEIGFYSGSSILEIGISDGRSAAVMLRGACARLDCAASPLYFGIGYTTEVICQAAATLAAEKLLPHCLLFHGDIRQFVEVFRLSPSAIVINSVGAFSEICQALITLSAFCPHGVPVLFQRYETDEGRIDYCGVKIAIELCQGQDLIEPAGWFGGTALYQTGAAFCGSSTRFPKDDFMNCQRVLAERYTFCPNLQTELPREGG